MRIAIDSSSLDGMTKLLMNLPGECDRARRSGLKSTGNVGRARMRAFVESGGKGSWKKVHPFTARYYRTRERLGSLTYQWREHKHGEEPFEWLGKFSRYRVNFEGTSVRIHFGKSRKGKLGTFDPFVMSVVKRAEEGETIPVTDKMRKLFGTTRRGKRNPRLGVTFFPLSKDIKQLKTEPRHIFDHIYQDLDSWAMDHFKKIFWQSLKRYREGTEKR